MTIRKTPLSLTNIAMLTALTLTTNTYAKDQHLIDYAHVTESTPVYRTIEERVPVERCWVQTVRDEVRTQRQPSATGTLLGGVIGGAVGHAVGHGKSNKKLGTVIGSVIGMSIGNDVSRRNTHVHAGTQVSYRDVERCEITEKVDTREQLIGYDVSYRYQGQSYSTRMDKAPGKQIKVAISVSPIVD